jgi:SnoaL-like polyketide cyclase
MENQRQDSFRGGGVAHDADQLREFAEPCTEAWCSQDPEQVAANFASGSLTINESDPSVGRAAITEAARSLMVAFPDMKVLMDDLRIHGEGAEYHWTLVGTNTGPGGSGKTVRISGFEEWIVGEDGLIASLLGHFDEAEYERQLEHGAGSSRLAGADVPGSRLRYRRLCHVDRSGYRCGRTRAPDRSLRRRSGGVGRRAAAPTFRTCGAVAFRARLFDPAPAVRRLPVPAA